MFNVWRIEIKRLRLQIKGLRLCGRVCSEFNEIHLQNKSYANKFALTRQKMDERRGEGGICCGEGYCNDSKRG